MEELLKAQGLSDEQISSIIKAMSDNKIYTTSLENADERYSKLKGQKNDWSKSEKELREQLKSLSEKYAGSEDSLKTIASLEAKIKDMGIKDYLKTEITGLKNPKYFDLLLTHIDRTKIEANENGEYSGFDAKQLKEQFADLFESNGNPPSWNNPPKGEPKPGEESIGSRLAKMNASQNAIKENPYF